LQSIYIYKGVSIIFIRFEHVGQITFHNSAETVIEYIGCKSPIGINILNGRMFNPSEMNEQYMI